jgi:hypothetical protein
VSWNDWITKTLLSCNVPTKRNVEDDDSQQEDFNCCSRNTLRIQTAVYSFLKTHTNLIKTVIKTVLLGVFFAYLGYAFYYKFGGEPEWRLLMCTQQLKSSCWLSSSSTFLLVGTLFTRVSPSPICKEWDIDDECDLVKGKCVWNKR